MNALLLQKKRIANALGYLMSLLVLGALTDAHAQSGHEGWYQVEMIIFARKNDTKQEHWPSNIKLRYPGNWVELKDPNAVNLDENSTSDIAVSTTIDLTKEAFYKLPQTERQLNTEAQKITRDHRYDVLFHQAWRQVIGNKNNAKNIIITGGKQFGQYQELEGTISLSVATYLKLQTNLWFTQFDVNIGQEQTIQWPEIPVRPNYKKPTDPALSLDADIDFSHALEKENNTWLNNATTIADSPEAFITRQIILIKQARDMRSNEVHYVDHPMVGIVLKITPYQSANGVSP